MRGLAGLLISASSFADVRRWLVVLRFAALLCFPSCFPCCNLRSTGSDLCLPVAVFTVLPSSELSSIVIN